MFRSAKSIQIQPVIAKLKNVNKIEKPDLFEFCKYIDSLLPMVRSAIDNNSFFINMCGLCIGYLILDVNIMFVAILVILFGCCLILF